MAALHEQRGEEGAANGQRMRDRLVECGPSAIAPTIAAIRRHGVWTRRYCQLPHALRGLGEPARHALLTAIDSEQDAAARVYLISALQLGFSDFSRLERWMADANAGALPAFHMARFAADIRREFPEAPALGEDGRVNAAFVDWWRTNKQADK